MRWLLLAGFLAVSCKSNSASEGNGVPTPSTETTSGKAAMSRFTLTEAGDDTNKVIVELSVPSNWHTDPANATAWTSEGAVMLSLANVSTGGRDDATRVEKAIKMQFGDTTGATRNDYPDGRVWVSQPLGANVHARMFVPYASGVAMGIAVLSNTSKLGGVKAAFETLEIAR